MEEENVIVFHIGIYKTGTTALQSFLTLNRQQLKQQGWNYPILSNSRATWRGNGIPLFYEDKREQILDEVMQCVTDNNVIISTEWIWGFNDVQLEKFFGAILERYGNIKIVVYLRRQDEFIESMYNQRVKQLVREPRTIQQYYQEPKSSPPLWDYLHKLKILERLVGDRLIVRRYSKDIISDFLSVIGVELENVEMPPVDRSNLSLGSRLLEIRRVMNSLEILPLQWDRSFMVFNEQNVATGRKDYYKIMSPEMRRDILKEYEADNEEIARRYLKDGKPLFEDMNVDIPYKEYRATPLEEEMIRVFFSFTANLERQMKNMAIKLLGNKKKLAYFGAGNICRKCLESGLYRPNIIIDNKGGREIDGIPVVNLDDMTNWRDYYVIITTGRFHRENYWTLMENDLTEIQDFVYYWDLNWNQV